MKNAVLKVLKVLAIGVAAAVLGHILTGCDSGGEQNVAGDASADSLPPAQLDAGTPKVDTGVLMADTGTLKTDTGVPTADMGTSKVDTGTATSPCTAIVQGKAVSFPTLKYIVSDIPVTCDDPGYAKYPFVGLTCVQLEELYPDQIGDICCIPLWNTTGDALTKSQPACARSGSVLIGSGNTVLCSTDGKFKGWICG